MEIGGVVEPMATALKKAIEEHKPWLTVDEIKKGIEKCARSRNRQTVGLRETTPLKNQRDFPQSLPVGYC